MLSLRPGQRPPDYYRRKADQEWEMAGLARQDRDHKAERQHTERAREYEQLAKEYRS